MHKRVMNNENGQFCFVLIRKRFRVRLECPKKTWKRI